MPKNSRYPNIGIRSKNELAKRISGGAGTYIKSLKLINDVLSNYNRYWRDNRKSSDPKKNKYVRDASGTKLGELLSLIDKKILLPNDRLLPAFIFGGVAGRNHIKADLYLLGNRKRRTKLGADISRFFEQNDIQRLEFLLSGKCGCTRKASKIISSLCCVPIGPKSCGSSTKTIARGFATSTRLAIWCNLDLFLRVDWAVKRLLKGHNPRVTIFVDDIGISASNVDESLMDSVYNKIDEIFKYYDDKHTLQLNDDKKNIQSYKSGIEHLGLRFGRNKVMMGSKTINRWRSLRKKLENANLSQEEKRDVVLKVRSYKRYSGYIKRLNRNKIESNS